MPTQPPCVVDEVRPLVAAPLHVETALPTTVSEDVEMKNSVAGQDSTPLPAEEPMEESTIVGSPVRYSTQVKVGDFGFFLFMVYCRLGSALPACSFKRSVETVTDSEC